LETTIFGEQTGGAKNLTGNSGYNSQQTGSCTGMFRQANRRTSSPAENFRRQTRLTGTSAENTRGKIFVCKNLQNLSKTCSMLVQSYN
jgi:hypothetical protein